MELNGITISGNITIIGETPPVEGGTVSLLTVGSTDYKIHTFTSTGTLQVNYAQAVELVLVGGGGGGTVGYYGGGNFHSPGNGGDGGYAVTTSTYLAAGSYTISVGSGGANGYNHINFNGLPGGPTIAFGLTALGGGGGSSTRLNQAGATNGILSSIGGSSFQYGQGGPITSGTTNGQPGTNGTGNGGASGGDGNFPGGRGGDGVVILRYSY
jgi:hypothetical protein